MKISSLGTAQDRRSRLIMPILFASAIGCSNAQIATVGPNAGAVTRNSERDPSSSQEDFANNPRAISNVVDGAKSAASADLSLARVPSETEAAELIRNDFAANGKSADVIYVDIRHLNQGSVGTKDLDGVRFGIAKTLNSISIAANIVKLNNIDPASTIFRVKLSDYTLSSGWSIILKDKLAGNNVSTIEGATVVKGDWLVFAATRPEAYNSVMRIPGSVAGLEGEIGADYNKAVYINAPATTVTFFGRVLQRIPINVGGKAGGYYWRSYDPVGKPLEASGFSNPEGLRFATLPALWAGEFFFSLPNGLQGYSLSGFIFQTRLDAQLFAATDWRRSQDGLTKCAGNSKNCGYVLNGESCMTCHAGGINAPAKVLGYKGVGTQKDAEDLFSQDRDRFMTALGELGYSDYQGGEPILETIGRFKDRTKNVDKRVQAGELEGVSTNSGMFTRK